MTPDTRTLSINVSKSGVLIDNLNQFSHLELAGIGHMLAIEATDRIRACNSSRQKTNQQPNTDTHTMD